MAKKKEDYLKYYIGAEVIGKYLDEDRKGYLSGVNNGGFECEIQFFEEDGFNVFEKPEFNESSEVKLCLRKLSSMSEEVIKECRLLMYGEVDMAKQIYRYSETPDSFHYLLSKGFDLWNLIDEGLAIDLNSLNTQP